LLGLAAWGLVALPRPRHPQVGAAGLGLAGLALLAGVAVATAQNHYFNSAFAKSPDWRGLASYLAETARSGEVVVVNYPDPAFFLYYHGPMPVEAPPPAPLAGGGAATAGSATAATVSQLARLRDQYQHIRFFFQPSAGYDPDGFVGQWLDGCCEKL